MIRKIVCLCGSTKFKGAYERANKQETLRGNIVLSVGFFMHSDSESITEEAKNDLDALHLDKIRLADEILVLNIGGYVGSSTMNEIRFAASIAKPIRWWVPDDIPRECLRLLGY